MTQVDSEPRPGAASEGSDAEILPLTTKVAYGLGDFASQLVWTLCTSYLLVFYTDTVGLAAGAISLLLLVARVVDAVIDPVIGAVAERTTTRFGRFRPYILFGTPILAVMFVLTFTAPSFGGSHSARITWAAVTYGLLGILYSLVNLPYGALSTVMTRNPRDLVSLNSFRMIGTNLGAVLLSAISMPLLLMFSGVGDGETTTVRGYTLTALVMAVIAVPLFYFLAHRCREVITPVKRDRVPLSTTVKVVFGNWPLMLVFASFLLMMTGFFGRMGVVLYYYMYDLHRYDLIALLMAAPSLAGAVGIVLFARFANRFGKKPMVILSFVLGGLLLIALYFVDYTNIGLIITLTLLYGLAQYAAPIIMSMVPDCIDRAEDRTGVRADGTSYAVISFSTKLASALGGSVGVLLLAAVGYVANADQTPEAMQGINVVVNVIPGIATLLGAVPMLFYPITSAGHAETIGRLQARKAAAAAEG